MVTTSTSNLPKALPFWSSLALIPLAWAAGLWGGWWLLGVPLGGWVVFSLLDALSGLNTENLEAGTPTNELAWHRAITLIWGPVQFITLFGLILLVSTKGALLWWEIACLTISLGMLGGTVGIVYAHELMHQPTRLERWLGDILMAMALYGHFRSEHLLVHHRYVCTPRDPVTARYNEGFHRFFIRVLPACLRSAWRAEIGRLGQRGLSRFHASNPFWRYGLLQFGFLVLAISLGGATGLLMFLGQAFVAVWQLELVNYMEHYGLTRRHLGDGKYEHQKPHHSWNAAHRATNWLLINLQRHSDHHHRPDRRFPLLQTYGGTEAPQLPYGYPIMGMLAMVPPLWRQRMNPRVRLWRKFFYPDISDWEDYNQGRTPMPR